MVILFTVKSDTTTQYTLVWYLQFQLISRAPIHNHTPLQPESTCVSSGYVTNHMVDKAYSPLAAFSTRDPLAMNLNNSWWFWHLPKYCELV